jgi:hypothetical protein
MARARSSAHSPPSKVCRRLQLTCRNRKDEHPRGRRNCSGIADGPNPSANRRQDRPAWGLAA